MRCDLRDCRLAALPLVASWLMTDLVHSVTLETEHHKKVRKLRTRKIPLELIRRASHEKRGSPRSIGFSEFQSTTMTSFILVSFASYNLLIQTNSQEHCLESYHAPSIVSSCSLQPEARTREGVHPLRRPQNRISSDPPCTETYMCS